MKFFQRLAIPQIIGNINDSISVSASDFNEYEFIVSLDGCAPENCVLVSMGDELEWVDNSVLNDFLKIKSY